MTQEIRAAFAVLVRNWLASASVVAAVGLSVAANAAIFAVIDGVLLRPLPYVDSDSLVRLDLKTSTSARLSGDDQQAAVDRAVTTSLLRGRADAGNLLLFDPAGRAASEWGVRPHYMDAAGFDLLGVQPHLGRRFVEEDAVGPPFSVVLGYDLWRTRFGADESVVGRSVEIPGTSKGDIWNVVGVMPPGFSFPLGANFWVPPYRFIPRSDYPHYGRLADGVGIDQLRAQLPEFDVVGLQQHFTGMGALPLAPVLIATSLFLLVAWLQISSLLFMRATARTREIAIRLALGATPAQMLRQFAYEGGLLALASLILAALCVPALTSAVVWFLPSEVTLGRYISPDIRSALFAIALSAAGVLFFTMLPLDLIRRNDPQTLIRGVSIAPGIRTARVRQALFLGQIAATTAVVYLGALMSHSYSKLSEVDLGFEPTRVAVMQMPTADAPVTPGPGRNLRSAFDLQRSMVRQTMQSLQALPAVSVVSGANSSPMPRAPEARLISLSSNLASGQETTDARWEVILPEFPGVLGVTLLAGREPSQAEIAGTGPGSGQLALINESLARQLERFGPPLDQTVSLNAVLKFRVVGVLPDVRLERPDQAAAPTLFSYTSPPSVTSHIWLRARTDSGPVREQIAAVLRGVWGDRAPEAAFATEAIYASTADSRARMFLLSFACLLTIPLTMIGISGALTHAARLRRGEMAIRQALGATVGQVRVKVFGATAVATLAAVLFGLILGVGVGRLIASTIFGVEAISLTSVVVATLVVLLIALLSAIAPVRGVSKGALAEVLRDA